MKCPVCEETLQLTDRQGVEIDYCPKCRGIWLDRGELQKLIDLSMALVNVTPPPAPPAQRHVEQVNRYYGTDREHRHDDGYYNNHGSRPYGYDKPKKRESWLSELFDFD